ncbi:hypothetical protein OG244_23145 [Streptomyces brevispora]|nr:hypothetical protein [Streptomyces brevispora]
MVGEVLTPYLVPWHLSQIPKRKSGGLVSNGKIIRNCKRTKIKKYVVIWTQAKNVSCDIRASVRTPQSLNVGGFGVGPFGGDEPDSAYLANMAMNPFDIFRHGSASDHSLRHFFGTRRKLLTNWLARKSNGGLGFFSSLDN